MDMIIAFITHYPIVGSILMIMGALRVVFKPFFMMIQAYVDYTVDPSDNAFLAKVMSSPVYLFIEKALDFFASVKLPGKPV